MVRHASFVDAIIALNTNDTAKIAPVAQLDRASDYESEGRTFESFRARQYLAATYRAKIKGVLRDLQGSPLPGEPISGCMIKFTSALSVDGKK